MAERVYDSYAKEHHWLLAEAEYSNLVEEFNFLQNLRAAGVDNWDGYHYGFGGDPNE